MSATYIEIDNFRQQCADDENKEEVEEPLIELVAM